ncbi:CAP-associated domain-containing protein [Cohnella terricola]|uniref:Copper amine oxidase n=1 Tax=Cohnella terricola TaxID=1289167 RepID=A0A559JWX8_9BACL|nr:CAP-associated domain-containing protein [Cohnella terricola]TVY04392.1 copper amine oxidase [Cohnella terricola]
MNQTMLRKMSRKLIVIVAFVTAFISASPQPSSAANAGFKDVPASHWAYKAINQAASDGWVNGYSDGTFRLAQSVSEAEFLKLLLEAAVPGELPTRQPGETWIAPYYKYAQEYKFPLSASGDSFDRGGAAQLIAALDGEILGRTAAVQYLLDKGLSKGVTSATVEGYQMGNTLSRAEAVQFIFNVLAAGGKSEPSAPITTAAYRLRDIAIGDTDTSVTAKLGSPDRVDPSEYGFQWYVYNQDYKQYAQIGIGGGKVVALYSNADAWESADGLRIGSPKASIAEKLGNGRSITDLETKINVSTDSAMYPSYEIKGSYVTFMLDQFDNGKIMGIYIVEKKTAAARKGSYGTVSSAVLSAYEREVWDLTNVSRVLVGKKALVWDDLAASTSRNHSKDMGENNYFDHDNQQGLSPFDRMKAGGIVYSAAAENIAAGQINAVFAHAGWMNSQGHRNNILGDDFERLGVGLSYSAKFKYQIYYTQNFYTPR